MAIYEGSDVKLLIDIKAIGFDQSSGDAQYTIELYNNGKKKVYTQNSIRTDGEGNHFLPVKKTDLEAGSLVAVVTVKIPDMDFDGYREEKAKPINLGPILPTKL